MFERNTSNIKEAGVGCSWLDTVTITLSSKLPFRVIEGTRFSGKIGMSTIE